MQCARHSLQYRELDLSQCSKVKWDPTRQVCSSFRLTPVCPQKLQTHFFVSHTNSCPTECMYVNQLQVLLSLSFMQVDPEICCWAADQKHLNFGTTRWDTDHIYSWESARQKCSHLILHPIMWPPYTLYSDVKLYSCWMFRLFYTWGIPFHSKMKWRPPRITWYIMKIRNVIKISSLWVVSQQEVKSCVVFLGPAGPVAKGL